MNRVTSLVLTLAGGEVLRGGGGRAHVNIAMTTAHYEGGLPCVRTADGNVGGKVRWFDTVPSYPTRVNAEPRWLGDSIRVICTRYPE